MTDATSSIKFDQYLLQKPILQRYPPCDFYNRIRAILSQIQPPNLPDIVLTGTSDTHTLELAVRNAISIFNNGVDKPVSIMTFEGSSSGRSLGTLSLSEEEALLERLPSIETVKVPLPAAKLPIYLNEVYNTKRETESLNHIAQLIDSHKQNKPIAAIVIEPILNRGNYFASFNFYKNLRKLAKSRGVYFIVNEIHTGAGPTGKFWASDHWGIEDVGDFLVFGKKCQVSGYFTHPNCRPSNPLEITDNWNNAGWKLVKLEPFIKTIHRRKLLERTADTGAYLRSQLERIAKEKKCIMNVRGEGTFIGFDLPNRKDEPSRMVNYLKNKGINVKLCSENTIGLRPALICEAIHCSHLIKALNEYPYKQTIEPLH